MTKRGRVEEERATSKKEFWDSYGESQGILPKKKRTLIGRRTVQT